MQTYITNGIIGASTGLGSALIGFLGNSTKEGFNFQKCLPTLLTGVVAGAISGFVSPDPMAAVTAALGGEVVRKSLNSYGKPEAPK